MLSYPFLIFPIWSPALILANPAQTFSQITRVLRLVIGRVRWSERIISDPEYLVARC